MTSSRRREWDEEEEEDGDDNNDDDDDNDVTTTTTTATRPMARSDGEGCRTVESNIGGCGLVLALNRVVSRDCGLSLCYYYGGGCVFKG